MSDMPPSGTPRDGTPHPLPGPPERLATLGEAADALAVSTRTVRRYIGYGYLEGYRVGPRSIRVSVADVNRLLARLPDRPGEDM